MNRDRNSIPDPDYSTVTVEELVGYLVVMEHHARRCVIPYLDGPDRRAQDVYHHAGQVVYRLTAEELRMLSQRGAHPKVLAFLHRVRCELELIYQELRRRVRNLPVGRAVLQVRRHDAPPEAVAGLVRALHVERLRTYHPKKEDDGDLRCIALEGAVRGYREMGDKAVEGLPFPKSISLNLPPDVRVHLPPTPWWEWSELLAYEFRSASKLLQPVLSGKVEELPTRVWARLKDHRRKRRAKKRTGIEVPIAEEPDGNDEPHAHLRPAVEPDRPDFEAMLDAQNTRRRLYEVASKRWGERGRAFVDALQEGKSVSEAARAAGVSRATGHKYQRELKRVEKSRR
jgi:hypothetical protein